MIRLLPDTADQTVYLTLNEGRQYFTEVFSDYLLIITRQEGYVNGQTLAQVPVIVYDNQRITKLTITTVDLTSMGRYVYKVYGQNSDSNIDPTDVVVVGMVEQGQLLLTDGTVYFEENTGNIPNDVRN